MLLAKLIHINMDKIKRPKLYTLPDTLQAVQHPPPSRSPCAARPAFGRVCRCVACCGRSGLHLARSALLPVLCSLSGCAGGWGLHLWGIWGEPGVGWSTPRVEKIQKRHFPFLPTPSFLRKTPYPLLSISKISRKNKKTPTKGLRSVLYLPYKP